MHDPRIAVVGTVGLPPRYGGFESLADNLAQSFGANLRVYCAAASYDTPDSRPASGHHHGAELTYIPLKANGVQSTLYDFASMLHALWRGHRTLLVLGVSGAALIPCIKWLGPKTHIVVNIDGLEWKRSKWSPLARWALKAFEGLAVRHADVVVADNDAIAEHVLSSYGRPCSVIAYGGDHALRPGPPVPREAFALTVCRIEPENNIHLILESFSTQTQCPLVIVGNWDASDYGRALRRAHQGHAHLTMLDPIYDLDRLHRLRAACSMYVHGHSAGGTNPSLVEAMHFGMPILAFDCIYNRRTMENQGHYFQDVASLSRLLAAPRAPRDAAMKAIASRRYTWRLVCGAYRDLLKA